MIAEIIAKKAKQDGIDGFILKEFKNIYNDLPKEYYENFPYFYLDSRKAMLVRSKNRFCYYKVEQFIPEKDFWELISTLKNAGQRLTDIKKKKLNSVTWISDKTITIKI